MRVATIRPVIDQVEFSPFEYRRALLEAAEDQEVAIEAYSPLGTGRHLSDRTVREVARRYQRSPAQVLLRWAIQRNTIVLPKSTHRARIEENAQIFDFSLRDDDMEELDALDQTGLTARAASTSGGESPPRRQPHPEGERQQVGAEAGVKTRERFFPRLSPRT